MRNHETDILAFCHIPKASGTSFTDILRRKNGVRHLDVIPRAGDAGVYTPRSFGSDIKSFPIIRSMAGHGLRPYLDYGKVEARMTWITWMRDPLSRLLSGYRHSVEKNLSKKKFSTWLKEPGHKNRQAFFLGGDENSASTAKRIIEEKNIFVGFVEELETSMASLSCHLGDPSLVQWQMPMLNRAHSGLGEQDIVSMIQSHADLIEENIACDRELYAWAQRRKLRLAQDATCAFTPAQLREQNNQRAIARTFNHYGNRAFRYLYHFPRAKLWS